MDNSALIFIKPHAFNEDVVDFVEDFFKKHHLHVKRKKELTSEQILENGIIDKHYFALATTGLLKKPSQVVFSPEAYNSFQENYGEDLDVCIKKDRVFNSLDLQTKVGDLSCQELSHIWRNGKQARLSPGTYMSYLLNKDIYGINGFYPAMRESFIQPGHRVVLYKVSFDPNELSWQSFRHDIIGATDPEQAVAGSLRNLIMTKWKDLVLTKRPSIAENAIHASAGPLEGLRERVVWLGKSIGSDIFGKQLLDNGFSESQIQEWLNNEIVTIAGKTGPIFDLTEDIDSKDVIELLKI